MVPRPSPVAARIRSLRPVRGPAGASRAAVPRAAVLLAAALLLAAVLLAGCATSAAPEGATTTTATTTTATTGRVAAPPSTTAPAPAPPSTTAPPAAPLLQVVVEPSDAYRSVDGLVAGARHSLDLTMYELADPTVESLLAAAAGRGVAVRVLLDRDYSGGTVNGPAYSRLAAAGVQVRWAPSSVIFHQKTLTVDGSVSAIMTGNLVAKDEGDTRDFVVLDRQPAAVAAVTTTFGHDWDGDPVTSGTPGGGLVWSPGAEGPIVSVIDSARHTLSVENEEMDSAPVEAALAAAARRGVDVQVTMTADSEWAPALRSLAAAGVHVTTLPDSSRVLYIHAKAIVADGTTVDVGSQNFSTSSLDRNRELGLLTTDPAVVRPIATTLAADAALASVPTPMTATAPAPAPAPVAPSGGAGACTLDPEGNCYRSSEYCPARLRGQTVTGFDGPLTCVDRDGWRWEPAA